VLKQRFEAGSDVTCDVAAIVDDQVKRAILLRDSTQKLGIVLAATLSADPSPFDRLFFDINADDLSAWEETAPHLQ
jgi:hypothetical protein